MATEIRDWSIAVASLAVAVATIIYSIRSTEEERNAKLVEIGVSILRVDPTKEEQVSAARQWALDLIDANAGGIKFSSEARSELLKRKLGTLGGGTSGFNFSDTGDDPGDCCTTVPAQRPPRRAPQSN